MFDESIEEKACRKCEWWEPVDGGPVDAENQEGECRGTLPYFDPDTQRAVWPVSNHAKWCIGFTSKKPVTQPACPIGRPVE
jgi:hypothetical protein